MKITDDDGNERELSDKEKRAIDDAHTDKDNYYGLLFGGLLLILCLGAFFSVVGIFLSAVALLVRGLPIIAIVVLGLWIYIKVKR